MILVEITLNLNQKGKTVLHQVLNLLIKQKQKKVLFFSSKTEIPKAKIFVETFIEEAFVNAFQATKIMKPPETRNFRHLFAMNFHAKRVSEKKLGSLII